MKKPLQIPVIDLFAGPGGLGEGFSAYNRLCSHFKIMLSIEKDKVAHKTLTLRAFYRQFGYGNAPDEYYKFIKSNKYNEKKLLELLDHFDQGTTAKNEARCLELGVHNNIISRKINEAIGNRIKGNKPWVLIGGPPCQAYSLVGRARNKGKSEWSLDKDSRSKLYEEYLMVLAKFQPAVFAMENVKGMLSAKLNGIRIIEHIIEDLTNPNKAKYIQVKPLIDHQYSYRLYSFVKKCSSEEQLDPSDYVIKSEHYGIPQKRHRVIILGVREDYDCKFDVLKKQELIPVRKAIDDLPSKYSSFSNRKKGLSKIDQKLLSHKDWTLMLANFFSNNHFKDTLLCEVIHRYLANIGHSRPGPRTGVFNPTWFTCDRLEGYYCNHEPRTHMRSDFLRYFFVSCFGEAHNRSPKLEDFPRILLPAHKNADTDTFVDRFKVQLKNEPSATVTCHISKDGHYYIHPDPRQCRSLTVREAARLQTFSDDYFFCGNRTQQYHQVGNAVPPLLARQIAGIVYQILEKSGRI